MSGLAALGSFAGGLAGGLERGQMMRQRQQGLDRQAKLDTRMEKQQEATDAANAELQQANAAFAANMDMTALKPGQQPDPGMLAKAYNARGEVFKRSGNFDGLMKNYAEALPYYTQVRNRAMDQGLAQFEADGDPIKLAQTVYPHIYDGKEITMAKAGKDGSFEFALSDGTKKVVKPDALVMAVKRMRMDPALAAKIEFETMKADAKAAADINVLRAKGEDDRKTKGVELEGRKGLADVEHGYTMQQIGARTAGDLQVKRTPGAAAAEPTERVLSEGQRLMRKGKDGAYSEVATGLDKAAKPANAVKDFDSLHKMVQDVAGEVVNGPFGGNRQGSEATLNIARYAQALMKSDPSLVPGDAISRSMSEFKKRQPAQ